MSGHEHNRIFVETKFSIQKLHRVHMIIISLGITQNFDSFKAHIIKLLFVKSRVNTVDYT